MPPAPIVPGISVLCPTYGRVSRLPGLIMSFLQQDYAGPVEFIILNDRHDQIIGMAPGSAVEGRPVTILNISTQFPTLGEKRNRLLELATLPYVAWWDDDDRYLAHHLTQGMDMMRPGYRASHAAQIWLNDGKALTLSSPWSPFASAIIEKQAIIDAGGFPPRQMNEDIALLQVLVHTLRAFPAEFPGRCPTTIYRKPGTSNHTHASTYGTPTASAEGRAYMQGSVDVRIADGLEPSGPITIVPKWGVDYAALVRNAWIAARPDPHSLPL